MKRVRQADIQVEEEKNNPIPSSFCFLQKASGFDSYLTFLPHEEGGRLEANGPLGRLTDDKRQRGSNLIIDP